MAAPFKDPRTGIFYFRRVVPEALRPHFDAGRTEYKRSLDTRDAVEAKERYPAQAQIYEQKLTSARRMLLNQHLGAAASMVNAFLEGVDDGALRGIAMKLASLETEAFHHAHGLDPHASGARYDFGAPPDRVDLQDHTTRKQMLEAVPDFMPLPWLETLQRVATLPSFRPIDWAIAAVAYKAGIEAVPGSPVHEAIGRAYLDRLCTACAVRVEPTRTRIIPAPIVIAGMPAAEVAVVLSEAAEPKNSAPTITAVFESWSTFATREKKLVDEWRTAIRRFAELNDNPRVDRITPKMVRDYRRTCAGLPSPAPKAIATLPLREQVEIAEAQDLPTLAIDTVNKALSAIRVMLEHAVEDLEVIEDNVARSVKSLPREDTEDQRLPFTREEMRTVFTAEPPFKEDIARSVLAWMLLLAPFTGCRLSELGKLRPTNIRREDGIDFIALEPDRRLVRAKSKGTAKRVKTASAKRDIPVHPVLIEAGFLDMVAQRRADGADWLFPGLPTNKYGSRTQRLSRVMNDFLDDIGLSDPELVYHSFRHTGRRALRGKAPGEIIDLIFGHADGSVSSRYGRGAAMETLKQAVEKISYPEVDWNRSLHGYDPLPDKDNRAP